MANWQTARDNPNEFGWFELKSLVEVFWGWVQN